MKLGAGGFKGESSHGRELDAGEGVEAILSY